MEVLFDIAAVAHLVGVVLVESSGFHFDIDLCHDSPTSTSKATATLGGSGSSVAEKAVAASVAAGIVSSSKLSSSQTRSACSLSMETGSVVDRVRIDVWKG